MKKRLLCLGLLVVVSQLFATGCFRHHPVVDRWRGNHPCGACGPCASHPISVHRPIMDRHALAAEPTVGPLVGTAPCHGCGTTGLPVGLNTGNSDLVPDTHPPTIGYPTPITPGPTVVPSYELPHPMPVKPGGQ